MAVPLKTKYSHSVEVSSSSFVGPIVGSSNRITVARD